MRVPNLFFILPALLLVAGCSATNPMKADPQSPYPPSRPPQIGDILHLPTGLFVSEEQMLRVAADARIVFVGETHDNPASHRLELTVLRSLAERYPGQVALGMEMFTTRQQEILDDWIAGRIDEKDLLRRSGFDQSWGYDYYREILLFARDKGIPIIGLNADKSLARIVARNQPAELPEAERGELPADMDFEDPYQMAMTRAVFSDHAHGGGEIDGFLRVQTLWDETMAESVARFLQKPGHEEMRMMVMAGGNHIRYGFGIPRRVFRRLPVSYALVGSQELHVPPERQDRMMNISEPDFPMPPYDFMVFTDYEIPPNKPVKLGVLLEEKDGKVVVKGVMPKTPAAEAGVQEGDVVVAFDGAPVSESFDLIYAVKQKKPGDPGALTVERNGSPLDIEVTFREMTESDHGQMMKKP